MKLKERMQNSFFALSDNRLLGRKKLAISYVSLFLVFTLVLVTTMAWFTVKDTASINSQAFSLESSAALRVNDGQEDLSNHLVVKDFKLEEASSVDGRNMFFPSEGNFKDSTSAMKFREGTVGDRNKTYVYSTCSAPSRIIRQPGIQNRSPRPENPPAGKRRSSIR